MKYVVTNIVSSAIYGKDIDLRRMSAELDSCEYEPEQFPGAIMRFDGHKVLVFKNGKLVLAGFKDIPTLELYLEKFGEFLKTYEQVVDNEPNEE